MSPLPLRRRARAAVSLLALGAWLQASAPAPAHAKTKPSAAEVARTHHERGTRLFDLGRYREAMEAFEKAYEAKQDPVLLFNLAQCRRKLGELDEALRLYRNYLKREESPERRAEIQRIIDEVEKQRAAAAAPEGRPGAPATTSPSPASLSAPMPAPAEGGLSARAPEPGPPPVYKRTWFWVTVGAAVAGTAALTFALSRGGGSPRRFCQECPDPAFPVPAR
jgi:hypothetical protein